MRDRIPEIIRADGKVPHVYPLSQEVYVVELAKKLVEEAQEFAESADVLELCDVAEVLDALIGALGLGETMFARLREDKAQTNGRFASRLFLEKVTE